MDTASESATDQAQKASTLEKKRKEKDMVDDLKERAPRQLFLSKRKCR